MIHTQNGESHERRPEFAMRDAVVERGFFGYCPALPNQGADDRKQARRAVANNDAFGAQPPPPHQAQRDDSK